jgi:SHS2 domain-containing protein
VYWWLEHTSEVELELLADSERGVFEDAVCALAELLGFSETPHGGSTELRTVTVNTDRPGDRAALLVAWLDELVFLAESMGFVGLRLADFSLTGSRLMASVDGVVGDPPPLVKAVTLHALRFEPRDGGYLARVILDV